MGAGKVLLKYIKFNLQFIKSADTVDLKNEKTGFK
jgi:hypothetical protein